MSTCEEQIQPVRLEKSDILAVLVNRIAVLVRDAVSEDDVGAWS